MKKLILFALLVVTMTSCSTLRNYSTEGFVINENTVNYKGTPMAHLSGIEFALDNNKIVKEMTFKLLDTEYNDKILNLIAFLHAKYAEYEIEVEIPIELMDELNHKVD